MRCPDAQLYSRGSAETEQSGSLAITYVSQSHSSLRWAREGLGARGRCCQPEKRLALSQDGEEKMKQKRRVGKETISSFAWTDHGSSNPKKNVNFW